MVEQSGAWTIKTKHISVLIIVSSLLAGCATVPDVPNESLAQFSKSVATFEQDADAAFSGITVASEARFKANLLEELAEDDTYSLDKLDIETNFKTLSVTKVPYFLKLQKLKAEVSQLNTALVDYAKLLEKLADPNAISAETFDTLATNLNRNVLEVAPSIRSDTAKEDTGLFSLTAMAITKTYLQSKQSQGLVAAIKKNQPTIQRFSTHLQKAVLIIARAVNTEYLHDTRHLKLKVAKTKDRTKTVDELIARNKKHFTDLQTLKRLHTNYGRLPLIHAEVGDHILLGNSGLPKTVRMLETTAKLKADYQKTLTPGVPTTAPIPPTNPQTPVPMVNPAVPASAPVVSNPATPTS